MVSVIVGLRELMVLDIGKRNDEENAKEKLFTYASHVPVNSFKVRTFILIFFMAVFFFLILILGPPNNSG